MERVQGRRIEASYLRSVLFGLTHRISGPARRVATCGVRLRALVRPTLGGVQFTNSTVRPAISGPLISERQVSPTCTDCAFVIVPVDTISPAFKGE